MLKKKNQLVRRRKEEQALSLLAIKGVAVVPPILFFLILFWGAAGRGEWRTCGQAAAECRDKVEEVAVNKRYLYA